MATTASLLVNTVVGNQRKVSYRLTPDATNTSFITGLNVINDFSVEAQSQTTRNVGYTMNQSSSGPAAVNGEFHMSGIASGDEIVAVFWGN